MDREIHCSDCDAEFLLDVINDSNDTNKVGFCPFCGSEDILDLDEDLIEEELED